MFHLVAHARPGTLLFRTHEEAAALWRILTRTFPEAVALCLMPDHLHLVVPHADPGGKLGRAMSAFARWRNARRGEAGPVWTPHPEAEDLPDAAHRSRTERYVHLNPCRVGLVADPLAWPWSTHRDAVGYALRPAVPPRREPDRFHRYVSGDPTVAPEGTALPAVRHEPATWWAVVDTVCGVARRGVEAVREPGAVRTLALQTAWAHGLRDVGVLAGLAGCERTTVFRACRHRPDRARSLADPLQACVRAVGDPRFHALPSVDLRATAAWARYRRLR